MSRSIVQDRRECWACRRLYGIKTVRGLEEHHIYPGIPRRALSERYGLKVWLCAAHHNRPPFGVHFDPGLRLLLAQEGQRAFERAHSRAEFLESFGKNYLGGHKDGF